jgi:RNA-binding protein Nova
LPERVVTIIGDPTTNRKALEMIICKILEDPHSSSCLNISYGEVQGLVANPHPTGSPYAPVIPHGNPEPAVVQPSSSISTSNKSSAKSISPFVVSLGNGKSLDLSINTVPGWPAVDQTLMTQYLKQISVPLRSHGFTENTVDEIVRSLGCLATHGILTLEQLNSDPKAGTTSQAWSSSSENSSPLADLEANKINVNSYGLVTPTVLPVSPAASASNSTTISNQNEDVVDMDVQEHVVGAILGPGGRSIVELQQFSGARIQISKKGAFSPGTRNRVVTISGSHQAVATAKYLIEKRIQEEQDENRLSCY